MTNAELAQAYYKVAMRSKGGSVGPVSYSENLVKTSIESATFSLHEYYKEKGNLNGLTIHGFRSAKSKAKLICINVMTKGVEQTIEEMRNAQDEQYKPKPGKKVNKKIEDLDA